MPKNIYVVGGNGFARECYLHIRKAMAHGEDIVFGGFIGHNGYHVDFKALDKFFVGDLAQFAFGPNDYCVIGAGYPELRQKIFHDIKERLGRFHTLAVDCEINEFVELGEGNIFLASTISLDMKIGDGNLFNGHVVMGHDAQIGNFNFFGPHSQILGDVRIGDSNTVGAGALLLPHCAIGNDNKIAPLSAVYKGCRNNCYLLGNPAQKVGETA